MTKLRCSSCGSEFEASDEPTRRETVIWATGVVLGPCCASKLRRDLAPSATQPLAFGSRAKAEA